MPDCEMLIRRITRLLIINNKVGIVRTGSEPSSEFVSRALGKSERKVNFEETMGRSVPVN